MSDWDDDWDDSWGRDDQAILMTSASEREQTRDDTDYGWGDRTWSPESAANPDDLERFRHERPPHHGD